MIRRRLLAGGLAGSFALAVLPAVAVAAVTGLLASPAAATPADPQPGIGIGAVHTAAARDSLSVPVWTDTPAAHITTVDATLSFDGHVVDLVLGDPDGDGRYSPAGPIVLGDTLPTLGHWAVSVAADDSSGASATRADAGVFDFTDRLVELLAAGRSDPDDAPAG